MWHLLSLSVLPHTLTWVLVLGVILAFIMGFAMGANDVANTFGTSVGSGALTLRKALITASIFEVLGAASLGIRVTETINEISDYSCFKDDPALFMIGMLSSMIAASTWIIIASFLDLPVSATHSIVGAIVGMAVFLKGIKCINWSFKGLPSVFLSWATSPLISGLLAYAIYFCIAVFIMARSDPVRTAFVSLPIMFALGSLSIVVLVFNHFDVHPWIRPLVYCIVPIAISLMVHFLFVPWLRSRIYSFIPSSNDLSKCNRDLSTYQDEVVSNSGRDSSQVLIQIQTDQSSPSHLTVDQYSSQDIEVQPFQLERKLSTSLENNFVSCEKDVFQKARARQVFWWLQNFSASLASFAHGANDTANAIAPFAAIYVIWKSGSFDATKSVPFWTIMLGAFSIVCGLAILGYRVIQTVGTNITKVNYVNGFTSELSSSLTVVLASALKLPISSTHCQVGAIIGTGLVPSRVRGYVNPQDAALSALHNVNWVLFSKIAASWLITLPFSFLLSAACAYLFSLTLK